MKKLSKDQLKQHADIADRLGTARDALEAALEECFAVTGVIGEAWVAYQEAIVEAASFRDDLVRAMDDYAGERSDKWTESDAGSAYEEWKSEWENLAIEEGDMDPPDIDDIAVLTRAEFEELPTEPTS
jgi:hypothetical protein